jgi:hypothetical protein
MCNLGKSWLTKEEVAEVISWQGNLSLSWVEIQIKCFDQKILRTIARNISVQDFALF